jgi:hypothetical protein
MNIDVPVSTIVTTDQHTALKLELGSWLKLRVSLLPILKSL